MRTSLLLMGCGLLIASMYLAVICPAPSQAEDEPAGRKLAFLVGVKKYDHSQLKDLQFPEHDVEEFAEVLRKSGFTVIVLTTTGGAKDPARMPNIDNIHSQLKTLLKKSTKRDLILVGLAGHGIQPLGSDSAYFCPRDANPTITAGKGNDPSFAAEPDTLLSIDALLITLDNSGVGQKLLLMDACRNDPGVRGRRGIDKVKVSALPFETGVLLSCSPGQFSFEHKAWGTGHGAFFYQVIEGFKGQAHDDDEGGVTWDSLVRHVRKKVPQAVAKEYGSSGGEQRPNLIANLSEELPILARRSAESTSPTATRPSTTTPASKTRSLFNGVDLSGWTVKGVAGWSVEKGVLVGQTQAQPDIGWLMSADDYTDFELELEYKIGFASNSGIFLRAWPEGDVSGKEFAEVQLMDNDTEAAQNQLAKTRNLSLFKQFPPDVAPIAPANEWHAVRVVVVGSRVQVFFKDKKILDEVAQIPRSKGRIGLQLYPTRVEFRKIQITPK